MMPNVVRGGRMSGLMAYLAGPGRENEHTNPMVVAGDDRVTFAVEPGAQLSHDDAMTIGRILDQPRKAYGTEVTAPIKQWDHERQSYIKTGDRPAHVWHCSLSLRQDEGELSPEKWKAIAEDFVQRMGFIDPDGAKSSRWVALHHGPSKNGNDHIHIAVQLVREDGTKAHTFGDFQRSQKVCAYLEKEYDLEVVESRGQGRGIAGEKPAERERAQQQGRSMSARYELRRRLRTALATSSSADEYIQRLTDLNVKVAPSFAQGSMSTVRGYKVALPDGMNAKGQTVWYAPSKLDATLGWPNICKRFSHAGVSAAEDRLRSMHSSNTVQDQVKIHRFDPKLVDSLLSGKTGTTPDTLSNIYARLSMQLEQDRPGALWKLSEQFARASQGRGNARYAARMSSKFAAKRGRGWLAVIQQANRMSRAMASSSMAAARPQLAGNISGLVQAASTVVRTANASVQEAYRPGPRYERGRGDQSLGR